MADRSAKKRVAFNIVPSDNLEDKNARYNEK